jgi:hypothetical protein
MIPFLAVLWLLGTLVLILLGPLLPLAPETAGLVLQTYSFGLVVAGVLHLGLRYATAEGG